MASAPINGTGWKHDVFLNFRGTDTRNNFTSHLHHALCNKGIHPFIDDGLERGKVISPALLEAIEGSRMSILVFSQNYASSTYCLDELLRILECQKSKKQIVVPVFYNVSPEEVEKQTGRYGEAFTRYEDEAQSMEDLEKVEVWKAALSKAANFSGWPLSDGNEADFIQRIVEEVCNKLNKKFLHVADYPVGLDSRMEDVNHLLSVGSHGVRMVGICGIGGIGKTTIAKAIFNKFAKQFEGSCFLANVRQTSMQHGLAQLQETLLLEIVGDKKAFMGNCDLGISVLRDRLCSKRVFIVIDDVDDVNQLQKLVGELEWFGLGSRIVITTRDERLLVSHGVKRVYKVKELCHEDALCLFSSNAFKKPQPEENYGKLSHFVLKYVNGLPLALVVLGSHLYGRSIPEWESYLDKLKRISNKQIFDILRISFDGLEDNERAIFLDIACFFKGNYKNYVMEVLKACDFEPASGIPILVEKSLLSIENNRLQMHDLIQSMGWQVVHQESNVPGERSRLWFNEDVLPVLTDDMGTSKIEAIMLHSPEEEEIHLTAEAFTKMKRLRILIIRNAHISVWPGNLPNELRLLECHGCPLESLPSTFRARKLVALNMPNSLIKHLGVGFKNFRNLKYMDFRNCKFLTEIPDVSTIPNLETLNFEGCTSLIEIHPSIGFLEKLVFLSFAFCSNLESLPSCFKLRSLQCLYLHGCTKLEELPKTMEHMACLEELHLSDTAIKELPNLKNFRNLTCIDFRNCKFLRGTPDFSTIPCLEKLNFKGCTSLDKIHPSIGFLEKLVWLCFASCCNLKSLPSRIKLGSLQELYLNGCTKLEELPNTMQYMTCLEQLDLSGTAIKELPSSIEFLSKLETLALTGCRNFTSLPSGIYKLDSLETLNLDNCSQLSKFPEDTENTRRSRSSSSSIKLKKWVSLPSYILDYKLSIGYCNLSDLEFLKILSFSQLTVLNLSGNNFASIPSCISEFTRLNTLTMSECPRLKKIPKLPGSILQIVATGCKSLEQFSQLTQIFQFDAEARLASAAFLDFSNCHKLADNEGKNFEIRPYFDSRSSLWKFSVVLPGSEILPWFHYRSEGHSLSFKSSLIYGRIKALLLCLIIGLEDVAEKSNISHTVFIDGRCVGSNSWQFLALESDHMWFCLHDIEFSSNLPWLKNSGFSEVSFKIQSAATNAMVKRCGAYLVFKQQCSHL